MELAAYILAAPTPGPGAVVGWALVRAAIRKLYPVREGER